MLEKLGFFPIFIDMVSGGGLAKGHEIHLGALVFITDDSAWLQEAPLDVEALPVCGETHFCTCIRGVLLRQPSTQYRSAPMPTSLPAAHRGKRSGRSRLQRWVRHAVARQSATPQVTAIEPDETLYGLSDWLRRDCIQVRQQRPRGKSFDGQWTRQPSWLHP